jgi:hypothetical protein
MKKKLKFWTLYLICSGLFIVAASEVFLRFYVTYNPSYYVAFSNNEEGILRFPYGNIPINSDGFPDQNFQHEKVMPRVGYFGDSVCFGIGTGYGYRLTEHLERKFDRQEHMNFCHVSNGMNANAVKDTLKIVEKFKLDRVIYLMNLNDILPEDIDSESAKENVGKKFLDMETILGISQLRGRSYLYTAVRMVFKNTMVRQGYESHGHLSYELFPRENREIIVGTANRIAALNETLKAEDVPMTVIILPYEMQISEDAAETYKKIGIKWGEGFLELETQNILKQAFDIANVNWIDVQAAFVPPAIQEGKTFGVGETFVYNKGDKLDWNHPNREGHKIIAEFIINETLRQQEKSTLLGFKQSN